MSSSGAADTLNRARALLSSEQRAEIEVATALSWIPVTTSAALFDTVARIANREPEGLVDEITRRAVERTFTTVGMQTIAQLSGRRDGTMSFDHARGGAAYELRWSKA